eukprot:jgi/Ulvmu1/12428/UM009_0079.1
MTTTWDTSCYVIKHLFQSTRLRAALGGADVSDVLTPALTTTADETAAEAGLCHAVQELLRGLAAVCNEHSLFDYAETAHHQQEQSTQRAQQEGAPPAPQVEAEGRPWRAGQTLFTYIRSVSAAVEQVRDATMPLARTAEALAGVLGCPSEGCSGKHGQEDAPDNAELRLGYGAMVLGKLGHGTHACSLDQLLMQIARLCALCWAAVTCIKVLAHAYRSQGSSFLDQKMAGLLEISRLLFLLWSDVSHGLTQPLQGAVDVRVALGCSMSPEFVQAATEDLAKDLHEAAGVPKGCQNKSCFHVNLMIKLGAVQLEMLRDGNKEDSQPGAVPQAAAPAGLDHFLQALRMATNWCNATGTGRWAGPEQTIENAESVNRPRNGKCPVTRKIFRHRGPQEPLAAPCCGQPISAEGCSVLVQQQRLSDFPHAPECPGPRVLPAAMHEYCLHDEELEAACLADSVELQSFSAFVESSSKQGAADDVHDVSHGRISAEHVGWEILHESYKVAAICNRMRLPGTPMTEVKNTDWRLYVALHDVDGVLADSADAAETFRGLLSTGRQTSTPPSPRMPPQTLKKVILTAGVL